MITESFLNSCFSLILCKNTCVRRGKDLYRDILKILDFQDGKKTIEIPVTIQGKVDCLKQICNMLIDNKTVDNIIDSISFSKRFDQYKEFLDSKSSEELTDIKSLDITKQIRLRQKINTLFKNYDQLKNVLESINDGNFSSLDDIINDYEITIKQLYSNLMESNRNVTIEAAASLDMEKDGYDKIIETIKYKYDRTNKTPTGFPIFDNTIMIGGFEPSRLYVFGGGSGAGKSTILNNLIVNGVCNASSILTNSDRKKKVYIYITLENTIEEAWLRTYQPMFNKTTPEVLTEISRGIDIKKKVIDELEKSNSTIVMKYYPAMSISSVDLMGVLDEVIDQYGKESIMGIYIDYLDLLRTDTKFDMYRLELGYITLSLKTMAVQYNLPVITATQLSRAAYKIEHSSSLNLDQMSESIKKVEHADFVCLLAKDNNDDSVVFGRVGKNRSGKSGESITFKVDFSKFKFLSCMRVSNKKQSDASELGIMTLEDMPGF